MVEPNKTLSYTWGGLGLESVVTWTLTPTSAGTRLRMEQSGFRSDQRQAYGGARSGWPRFLENLEQGLGAHALKLAATLQSRLCYPLSSSGGDPIELERLGSTGPPLAIHCLHGCCHYNIVALGRQESAVWIGLLALLPLVFLLLTGLYLFVLPYANKWRSG